MATVAERFAGHAPQPDMLSGTPRAHAIDRWIYVFTAASFIGITLAGFVPDSLMKVDAVAAGKRPPFPLVLHFHAMLMGSFLLLLFAQTWLMATGRRALHIRLGILAFAIAPALVVVGFILVPTNYHMLQAAEQAASGAARAGLQQALLIWENIMLIQIRIGILFPLLLAIGLRARAADPGLHKRMMILATAMALPAGIDRIPWLPATMPDSPLSADLYTVVAISPMLVWDVVRNRRVHKAYWVWFAFFLPSAVAVNMMWNTPWWHQTAIGILGA
ncbi:hypothetical protein ACFSCW_11545 [Sphingomonas tabacisoli]|uniref:Uncharacterized protein n=1 Tax=Sphingomonas tabacisoli TaxID=2249466 RepID=A0ABW4I3A5_9SPHN